MGAALRTGVKDMFRLWRPALLLWAWTLLLAIPAWGPLAVWWRSALNHALEGDKILQRFQLGVFAELSHYDRSPMSAFILSTALALVGLTVIGNAFLAGGIIEVVVGSVRSRPVQDPADSPEPCGSNDGAFMHCFFGGAGRFFWRNLRLLIINSLVMALACGLLLAGGQVAVRPLRDTLSVSLAWTRVLCPLMLAGLALVYFDRVLDYARIRLVSDDLRSAFRAWVGAVVFTARRMAPVFGLWIWFAAQLGLLACLYLGCRSLLAGGTWRLIVAMAVTQQIFTCGRAALRVGLVSAEVSYWLSRA